MHLSPSARADRRNLVSGLAAVLALVATGCNASTTLFEELAEMRATTADLRVQFLKENDASNRAVMADTDEASVAYAHDAEQAASAVEGDVARLSPGMSQLGFTEESHLLAEFQKSFAAYREVDRKILALAVENTNLKAQKMSFGPVRQTADSLRDSLAAVAKAVGAKDRCTASELAAQAMLAVREIQVLQAPHIAEITDAGMTELEKEMTDSRTRARDALSGLEKLVPPGTESLATAKSRLEQLEKQSDELVSLSRRNTNVLSLDLALRTKPPLTRACDDDLHSLEVALAGRGSKATR